MDEVPAQLNELLINFVNGLLPTAAAPLSAPALAAATARGAA